MYIKRRYMLEFLYKYITKIKNRLISLWSLLNKNNIIQKMLKQ